MKVTVFTARSTAISLAIAVLVAVALRLIGTPWGLVVLNGWAAGALGFLFPVARRLGRLRLAPRQPAMAPWMGVFMVGMGTVLPTMSLVRISVELDLAAGFALGLLIGLVGCVAFACGDVVATLEHRERGTEAN